MILLAACTQAGASPSAPLGPVSITVGATSRGQAISPGIYGVSQADAASLRALGATVNRWGGDPTSRYNWVQGHAWNAARDYGFRDTDYSAPLQGSAADRFVAHTLQAGAAALITVPALGWVARDGDGRHRSVGVPAQGGPPLSPGSDRIAGYDPTANQALTSVPSEARKPGPLLDPEPEGSVVYQDEWVHHLVDTFGRAPAGVRYYTIDNEPDLWSSVHTDVHPARMGYDDMLASYEAYAQAIRAQDPGALILGPDVSGWDSLLYSDLDRGDDGYRTHADRRSHGDQDFLPWWLGQVARQDAALGFRTLNLVDVHWYPQEAGVYSAAADPATRVLRTRSTRTLVDPSYVDESWIGQRVALLPRLKSWIAEGYPGTGIAITEYNWGGEKDASGAVALADALGMFGREGVALATYWTFPPPDSPAGAAFRLYRDYDGRGATFGDTELPVTLPADTGVSAFAARHSDSGELDVVLVNERLTIAPVTVAVKSSNAHAGADLFQIAPDSSRIARLTVPDITAPLTLPPLSVSLLRQTLN
jgi:hypothetical protein